MRKHLRTLGSTKPLNPYGRGITFGLTVLGLALMVSVSIIALPVLFPSPFALSKLDGAIGFTIRGATAGGLAGSSVSGIGDINGDGLDDILIGAPFANQSHVVFGKPRNSPFAALFQASNLNGTNGFTLHGIGGQSGTSVSSAGDINGDGINDFLIGAPLANAGQTFVIFGRPSGLSFPAVLDLSSLNGMNGFVVNGKVAQDWSGISVSSAGDINGDGINDFLIGAPLADPSGRENAGQAYVVFGRPLSSPFPAALELNSLNGTNGFSLDGIVPGDRTGEFVSRAGDVNGDGLDDIILGAKYGTLNGRFRAGRSYVVFGRPLSSPFPPVLELSSLDGTNGFALNGIDAKNEVSSVSSAGDINGDGIGDLLIASPGARSGAGQGYVIFGRPSSSVFPAVLELSSLDGTNGFFLNDGVMAVSAAGDVNGDGLDDILVGAPFARPQGKVAAGQSYIVFGRASGSHFPMTLELSGLNGTDGFVLQGVAAFDTSGSSVSAAGDINADGLSDILIGAPNAITGRFLGAVYVVFGRKFVTGKGPCALDVTDRIRVISDPIVYDSGTQLFVQRLKLRNISNDYIPDPVYLVVDNLTVRTRLANQNGVTQCAAPLGSPYTKVNLGLDKVLTPRDYGVVILKFRQAVTRQIRYIPRVLAGDMPR